MYFIYVFVTRRAALGARVVAVVSRRWRRAHFIVDLRSFYVSHSSTCRCAGSVFVSPLGPVGVRSAVSFLLACCVGPPSSASRSPPCFLRSSRCGSIASSVHVSCWLVHAFASPVSAPPIASPCSRAPSPFVRVSRFVRVSLSVFLLGKGGLPTSGVKTQRMSPRGLSLRATTLALHSSLLCLQQP